MNGIETNAFYAVFDGHAGYQASEYCQKNLPGKLNKLFRGEIGQKEIKKGKFKLFH